MPASAELQARAELQTRAIAAIADQKPNWQTAPAAPTDLTRAPAPSMIVEPTTVPEATVVQSQTLPAATAPANEPLTVITVSHDQDVSQEMTRYVKVEDSRTAAVLNAPPPQPAPMQPITAEVAPSEPERIVVAEWPDDLGLVLPSEQH